MIEENKDQKPEATVDPEEVLLAHAEAIDVLQAESQLADGRLKMLEGTARQGAAFRIRGSRAADGTLEVKLTERAVPVRYAGIKRDVAVGDRQIARQKQAEAEARAAADADAASKGA